MHIQLKMINSIMKPLCVMYTERYFLIKNCKKLRLSKIYILLKVAFEPSSLICLKSLQIKYSQNCCIKELKL